MEFSVLFESVDMICIARDYDDYFVTNSLKSHLVIYRALLKGAS